MRLVPAVTNADGGSLAEGGGGGGGSGGRGGGGEGEARVQVFD